LVLRRKKDKIIQKKKIKNKKTKFYFFIFYFLFFFFFLEKKMLRQACSQGKKFLEAQYAFKILMIHGILQFTLLIALRCVLHRCESQEIRC